MSTALTNNNRVNIPAVCRLHRTDTKATVGSGIVIGPGLLLTSSTAVPSKIQARHIVATFFEGTKKKPVEVQLQADRYYFSAMYPAEMDYCLVGCDEAAIFNITPARVPLTWKGWSSVEEGDVLLVVEHPFGSDVSPTAAASCSTSAATSASMPPIAQRSADGAAEASGATAVSLEQKRFEQVLRCRNDFFFLKANGNWTTCGCPTFDEDGSLVGIQSQSRADGEGVVNRVLSITAIVRHLFANAQLLHLPQDGLSFDDVWESWYIENDVARIVSILANFKEKSMVQNVTRRLCELTANPQLVKTVVVNGGIDVILYSLRAFREEEQLGEVGLRALWNLSIGEEENLKQICKGDGVVTVLEMMESFPSNETILQLGAVLLHNISTCKAAPDFSAGLGSRAIQALYPGFERFRESVVLQKFSLSFYTTLVRCSKELAVELVNRNFIQHIIHIIEEKVKQIFLMEVVVRFIAEIAQYKDVVDGICTQVAKFGTSSMTYLIDLVVHLMFEYRDLDTILVNGNQALWGLGSSPLCRALILENPRSTEALRISLPALSATTYR